MSDPATLTSVAEPTKRAIQREDKKMARRRYQRGSLFVRGKRRMVYVLRYYEDVLLSDNSLGRQRRSVVLGLVSEVGSKRKAWEKADPILREMNQGGHQPQSVLTFADLIKQWKERILPLKKVSTQGFYRHVIDKYLLPFFSGKRLCDFSPGEIQGFITGQAQRFAWQTMQHMRVALNQILLPAVEWGYLRENPGRSIKMPRRPLRPEKVVLTPDQLRKLLQVLQEPYKTLVATAAVTGLRQCELFGLRWV